MFANLFKFYTFGLCMLMLVMHRSGWSPGGSSPIPPGVRAISRSYHSISSGGGSSGGFSHK